MFVDEVKLHAKGGRGGNGVTAFSRQPYEPKGPPSGGDGGRGGSIVVRASADVATLVDYHHRPHRSAERGRHGEGDLRRGSDGADVVLAVPVGTVVRDGRGVIIADLLAAGDEHVVARGGRGGRGNAAFRTSGRRAPRFHELGEPGQERSVVLELKLVADVALVGFPNVGKSSLIARLSAARPKIADYAFTTLSPNLGVVAVDDLDFVVADVPGLIEGASEGRGLGHRFLRHVERAGVLVHVLDCASYEQRDPREDLQVVVEELAAYDAQRAGETALPPMLERPALVWLNKADADPEVAEIVLPDIEAAGWEVVVGSAVTGAGLDRLRHRLADLVRLARSQRTDVEPSSVAQRPVLRPVGQGREDDWEVEVLAEGYRVTGERVERWVIMTDLDNDEAITHLQDRLVRAGVEQALVDAGARRGDAVEIAGALFDFDPRRTLPGEAEDVDVTVLVDDELELGEPEDADDHPDGRDGEGR